MSTDSSNQKRGIPRIYTGSWDDTLESNETPNAEANKISVKVKNKGLVKKNIGESVIWNHQKQKGNQHMKAYMNSFEFNYRVLDLVDYVESKLTPVQQEKGIVVYEEKDPDNSDDPWANFKDYCKEKNLNWKVIKKMIEYYVDTSFKSEVELVHNNAFKSVKEKNAIQSKSLASSSFEDLDI